MWDDELAAGEIASHFDISWPAVSQHLGVLKEAGFVVERCERNSRRYRADKAALGPPRGVVESMWRTSLNRNGRCGAPV